MGTVGRSQIPAGDDVLIRSTTSRASSLAALIAAAADVFALACTDAVVHADTLGDAPAYVDLCPTAVRS